MEETKKSLEKLGKLLAQIAWNIVFDAGFMWLAVNLVAVAFKIQFHLTYLQAISLCFFAVMWGAVFGSMRTGGKS